MQDEHPRYTQRTVEWGHWGITFMKPQSDRTLNFGAIVGTLYFPVGTRGPVDQNGIDYKSICKAWVNQGVLPEGLVQANQ